MKSAYELAMERLAKESPTVTLTQQQKEQLGEVDSRYLAKIAEREIFLRGELEQAREKGDAEAFSHLERQLSVERRNLQAECEEKKEQIRKGQGR